MGRVIIVKQHDITDCGPACLSSVLKYYGGYVPIEVIRLKCETNYSGTSAFNLIEAAKSYGLNAEGIRVSNIKSLKEKNNFPCIVHLKLKNNINHFAVLYEMKKTYVVIMDPSKGKVKLKNNEFEEIFTNVVILLQPQSTLMHYNKPDSIIKTISDFFIHNQKLTTRLLIYSVVLVIISIGTGYFLKLGSKLTNGGFGLPILYFLMIIFFVMYFLKGVLMYVKNKIVVYMNKNISCDMFKDFSHQLFILPLNFIKSKTSGEIISRYNDLSEMNITLPQLIITTSLDLIMALICIIFASFISVKLAIISIILMLVYILICFALKNPTLQNINENITKATNFNTNIIDSVNTIISTKYMSNEENIEKRLEKTGVEHLESNMHLELFLNKVDFAKNLIFEIGKWLILSYGLYLTFINKLNIIDLFTFEMIISYFFEPIREIMNEIPKICFIKSVIYKLNEFKIIQEEKKGIYSFKQGDIEVSKLSFSYNRDEIILNNIDLYIKENEKILLQGKSGSGKSTFCQILSKQLDYKVGEIKIGNVNINDIDNADFRKHITYIGQKDSLLVDTILNNILYERKTTDNFLKTICNICEIDEIVNKKMYRYNTLINESAMNISGGEKQRIVLARGLLKAGDIIILDEALSEVNKDMEERIVKRILTYFKNKTIIYVSHKNYINIFDKELKID